MSGREAILKRVRAALPAGGEREDAVRRRLADARAGVIPARGQLAPMKRTALFVAMAEKAAASVERVATADAVPAAVSAYLRGRNLPASVRMGADPRLAEMPWASETTLQIGHGPSDGNDEVAVSHAFAGVAETATLVLHSGADNPTTLNFLPDHHIVVLNAADIEGDLEACIARVRRQFGKGRMPRTLNLITGPSRSADIEQTLLLGAHGPRALHIIVVGEAA
jgi:L-lactate dehydrogenase complex protein LldG